MPRAEANSSLRIRFALPRPWWRTEETLGTGLRDLVIGLGRCVGHVDRDGERVDVYGTYLGVVADEN